ITPPLKPKHRAYLKAFNAIRHVKRNGKRLEKLPDPIREAVGLPIGVDGAFYLGGTAWDHKGEKNDLSIIDYNQVPAGQFSFYCQWVPTNDGKRLAWDGGEKFYHYVE